MREFRDTPLDDLDALTALCSLGITRHLDFRPPNRDLPLPGSGPWQTTPWQYTMSAFAATHGLPCPDDLETERKALHQRDSAHRFPVALVEVAYRVWSVQRCTEHLVAYLDGNKPLHVWHCEDDRQAWSNFTDITDPALQDFMSGSRCSARMSPGRPTTSAGSTQRCTASPCCRSSTISPRMHNS